jgi:DNA polymerase III epsilon subunit-like protein
MKILWFDVETGGLDSKTHPILEFAGLYEDTLIGDKSKAIFHEYIKYDKYPDGYKEACAINGLTEEILAEKGITPKEFYEKYLEFLGSKVDKHQKDDKMLLAGYNTDFDDGFNRQCFKNNGNQYYGSYFLNTRLNVMSTVAMAMKNGILPLMFNYKLETIARALQLKFKPHSALDDIKITRIINNMLEEKMGKKYEETKNM